MCYFEFNWTANVWQFRIADRWTDYRGQRSWATLNDVKASIAPGCCLVKTDTRAYQLMCEAA